MPTFDVGKSYNDVQEGRPLDEGWYEMEIVPDYDGNGPEMRPNKAMAEGGPGADGAGMNIVVSLETRSAIPEFDGRRFTLFLPLAKGDDATERNSNGQTKEDAKLERIGKVYYAFSKKEPEGSSVAFELGWRGMVKVIQKLDSQTQQIRNEIPYGDSFRPVE